MNASKKRGRRLLQRSGWAVAIAILVVMTSASSLAGVLLTVAGVMAMLGRLSVASKSPA